eukprot:6379686-Pyramimonas_sp.AAC.1
MQRGSPIPSVSVGAKSKQKPLASPPLLASGRPEEGSGAVCNSQANREVFVRHVAGPGRLRHRAPKRTADLRM